MPARLFIHCLLGAVLAALVPPAATLAASIAPGAPTISFDFSGFTGTGFSPSPTAGQLDSNDVVVNGMSDGDLAFGDTGTSGDFARGASPGGVTTGGAYAFDVGGSNPALGVQPTGSDFVPGSYAFQIVNGGGVDGTSVATSFKIYYYNDQPRSNSVTWQDSLDNATFSGFGASVSSPEAADVSPAWVLAADESVTVTFAPGEFSPGGSYFFRFLGDDLSGSGSRDEFAIDDVQFSATFVPEPSTWLLLAVGLLGLAGWRRRRARGTTS